MQVDVQLRKITAKTYFTWAAANALITNPCSPMKKVGFLPVIRHSVTNYSTGYSALRNFEEMTDIFHMPKVSLHCAEKYFKGSGIDIALILTKCFGSNTIKSVLSGGIICVPYFECKSSKNPEMGSILGRTHFE